MSTHAEATPAKAGVFLTKDEAEAMAILVNDAAGALKALLDSAEASLPPHDYKRRTAVLIGRDRAQRLEWVMEKLRGAR